MDKIYLKKEITKYLEWRPSVENLAAQPCTCSKVKMTPSLDFGECKKKTNKRGDKCKHQLVQLVIPEFVGIEPRERSLPRHQITSPVESVRASAPSKLCLQAGK